MHLENLKTFSDLVESQSFSHAARLNDVTQSAVSQQLRALEKHFDIFIVDRSSKQFRLTPEGERMHDSVKKMLRTYEELRSELGEMREMLIGTVRVSSVCSIGLHELPLYIKKYLKQYPRVDLRIEYRRADSVYEDVLSNGVDIGLVAFPEESKQLVTVPFLKDNMVLVTHPEHKLAQYDNVTVSDIRDEKFIAFTNKMPTRNAIDAILNKAGVNVDIAKECDNVETLKRAVEIHAGITIIPESAVRNEVRQGLLVCKTIEGIDFSRTLAMIYRRDRVITPQAQRFIDLLSGNPLLT